jgi:putative endonuclease
LKDQPKSGSTGKSTKGRAGSSLAKPTRGAGAGRADEAPSRSRRALGIEGERRAADFLARRGYRIIERNVRCGGVEVDLIARRGSLVVFVEVKTRRSDRYGPPYAAVDDAKQARLVRAASAWLGAHPGRARRIRFDVVSCLASDESDSSWQIEHLEGAFDAQGRGW